MQHPWKYAEESKSIAGISAINHSDFLLSRPMLCHKNSTRCFQYNLTESTPKLQVYKICPNRGGASHLRSSQTGALTGGGGSNALRCNPLHKQVAAAHANSDLILRRLLQHFHGAWGHLWLFGIYMLVHVPCHQGFVRMSKV